MTDRLTAPWSLTARTALLVGLALVSGPAAAGFETRGARHPHVRRIVRVRSVPVVPPPILVRDYLPRNHNVPMYNEPPRREPAW